MRDVGAARHAAEDRTQPWVGKHLLCEYNESVMHIVLWYGSSDAVQVSRSHAQEALSRIGLNVACVWGTMDYEETTIRRQSTD
jgi:hypothetical protein